MIFAIVPHYGRTNPVIYISICSLVGSVSVMSIKGFGVAVKLTFAGHNQFTHPSTYVFGIVTAGCILIQMNYFNKALDTFSTNVYVLRAVCRPVADLLYSVNPMYYVGFSSATIVASLILFQGFNTTDGTNTLSLLCGFIVTFLGVHLLNLSRKAADGEHHSALESGITNPRLSLQGRMSIDGWNGVAGTSLGAQHRSGRQNSLGRTHGTTVFDEDEADGMALSELPEVEEDDFDDADERTRLRNPQNERRVGSRSLSNSPSLSQAERRMH